ncbi:MAG: exodeoxyribonuclease VII small subunit [Candidatus Saccharimonas sp.]|nr:exodeoxyribonuclease VII small subunit [Candidatus Saccharimonas sp.]
MAQLQELVGWFEGDDFEIEQALDKYAEAEKLARDIQVQLTEYKNQITVLKKRFDQTDL